MAQLTDDCFAAGGPLMPLDDALDLLLGRLVTVVDSETLPLDRCVDRILAQPVVASIDVPPHDNSAVDGYAVYFDDLQADFDAVMSSLDYADDSDHDCEASPEAQG